MARKKSADVSAKKTTTKRRAAATNGPRSRARTKPAGGADGKPRGVRKGGEAQAAAGQLADLRREAETLHQALEQTRGEVLREAEQLIELRQNTQALRQGVEQAEQDLAALRLRIGETGVRLIEQVEREYAEAMGRLLDLRREADEAARRAAALSMQSQEAAAEVAEAAAEVRETLEEAAEEAVTYANAGAMLGDAGDIADETPAAALAQEAAQLGVTVAADSGMILEVVADSPAARAGLAPGDVVVGADGEPVRHGGDLRAAVSRAGAGRDITLRLIRADVSEEVRVRLPEQAAEAPPQ